MIPAVEEGWGDLENGNWIQFSEYPPTGWMGWCYGSCEGQVASEIVLGHWYNVDNEHIGFVWYVTDDAGSSADYDGLFEDN